MINMDKLAKAAEGDPAAKVTVNKAWLAEVHKTITTLEANQKRPVDSRLDSVFKSVFGR